MMRSMYSAVSGLKTHQTKMDVIGNNIANVNTVAFKSSSVTFRDILYQTTSNASGANVATGVGGVNAKQIGLGVSMAATSVSIETAGASETTGNPFDIKLTDKNSTNFFIVNDGTQNVFTRAGSFYVDGAGNLCMTSTGYTVMGWQVDPATGAVRKDTVSALRIMQEKNLTSAPEATTKGVMAGVLDENDADVKSDAGKVMNLNFYDNLGYAYTAKFAVKETGAAGKYTVELTNILDSNNKDLIAGYNYKEIGALFGSAGSTTEKSILTADALNASVHSYTVINPPTNPTGSLEIQDGAGATYVFDASTNLFVDTATPTKTLTLGDVYGVSNTLMSYLDPANPNPDFSLEPIWGDATKTFVVGYEVMQKFPMGVTTTVVRNCDAASAATAGYTLLPSGAVEDANGNTYVFDPLTNTFSDGTNTLTMKDVFGVSDAMNGYLTSTPPNPDYIVDIVKDPTTGDVTGYEIKKLSATFELEFNTDDGTFKGINKDKFATLNLGDAVGTISNGRDNLNVLGNFANIDIDFTQCLNYNNSGKSTIGMDAGDVDGTTGRGRKLGAMIGVSIDNNGKIFGSYDNGNTELLGQIAVAQFANASGLEKVGESCYQTTLNSGEFDGIGVEVSADGSSMTTGELEMSNVDLSTEFTQMITTQRGFQANSRVITTSDTLLEELVNLKR